MLRKSFPFFLIGCLAFCAAKTQQLTLDGYTHQLLFNMFRDKPDTAISDFLRSYTPSLFEKKKTLQTGIVTGSASGSRDQYEIHSFIFNRHPYFKSSFSIGKLELYCRHFPDERGVQVYAVKLWFEFDTQQEAEMAYSKMVEMLMPVSTAKNFSSVNGYMKAAFTDNKEEKGFTHVQFRLTADNLDKHRFKILFETENDLP